MYVNSPHCIDILKDIHGIEESEVLVFRPEPFVCGFVPSCSPQFALTTAAIGTLVRL